VLLWRCEWNCVLFLFLSSVSLCEVQWEQRERGVDLTPAGDWVTASTTGAGSALSLDGVLSLGQVTKCIQSYSEQNRILDSLESLILCCCCCYCFSFAEQNFKLPMRLGNGFVLVSVSLTSGSAVSVPVRRSHWFWLQQGALCKTT